MKKIDKTHKEFYLNKGNDSYILRVEIEQEYLNFNLKKINNVFEYIYKNKLKISKLVDELKLDEKYKFNNLILNIFDIIYEKNKIVINAKDNATFSIHIKIVDETIFEINLFKENITIDDKLRIIYNEIIKRKYFNNKIDNIINFEYINNLRNKIDLNGNKQNDDFNDNETNTKILKKGVPIISGLEEIYKKIKELFVEQKILYDNIIKELKEFEINIENKSNLNLNNDKKSKINIIEKNSKFNYLLDNIIEIKYKIDEDCSERIRIFGKQFVEKNKTNFKIIYKDTELDLAEKISIGDYEKNTGIFNIKLKFISHLTDLSHMFDKCFSLFSISFISKWDTSNVTDMSYMFNGCKFLSFLDDISFWNTNNVTNMSCMFSGCVSLSSLPDISKWNMCNIKNISCMFQSCEKLSSLPDISKWNLSKEIDMTYVFSGCKSLSFLPDISKWNFSNITSIRGMFNGCNLLSSLPDISKWNTSKIADMSFVFNLCNSLSSLPDISKWDTSRVTNMRSMFTKCCKLSSIPDISKWDVSNVKDMSFMFSGCSSLSSLPDISKWVNYKYIDKCRMFSDCSNELLIPKKFK